MMTVMVDADHCHDDMVVSLAKEQNMMLARMRMTLMLHCRWMPMNSIFSCCDNCNYYHHHRHHSLSVGTVDDHWGDDDESARSLADHQHIFRRRVGCNSPLETRSLCAIVAAAENVG